MRKRQLAEVAAFLPTVLVDKHWQPRAGDLLMAHVRRLAHPESHDCVSWTSRRTMRRDETLQIRTDVLLSTPFAHAVPSPDQNPHYHWRSSDEDQPAGARTADNESDSQSWMSHASGRLFNIPRIARVG